MKNTSLVAYKEVLISWEVECQGKPRTKARAKVKGAKFKESLFPIWENMET